MSADLATVPEASRRVLPHDLPAERSVLGAVLLDASSYREMAGVVEPGDFYHPAHAAIWQAFRDLTDDGEPLDEITLLARLRQNRTAILLRGFNDEAYFAELTSAVVVLASCRHHARMVRQHAQTRQLIQTCQSIAARGYADNLDHATFLAEGTQEILKLSRSSSGSAVLPLSHFLEEAQTEIERRYDRFTRGAQVAISTGFDSLNSALVGWEPGDLIIIAARPGMGKTSLVMNSLQATTETGTAQGLVFSIEMRGASLAQRLLSSEAAVNSFALRRGQLAPADLQRLVRAQVCLRKLPIWIDQTSGIELDKLIARAHAWRADPQQGGRIDPRTGKPYDAVIVVDYLQIIGGAHKNEDRVRFVTRASAALKQLGRDLGVPVIALSQLSRDLERRQDKRPVMADLRDSGSIEQDADVILFVYREAVYSKQADPSIAEAIVAKQRNGETCTVPLRWSAAVTRFEDEQASLIRVAYGTRQTEMHPNAPGSPSHPYEDMPE